MTHDLLDCDITLDPAITIYRDLVYAGRGTIRADGEIICDAVLGDDQDASDETYEAIRDAIDEDAVTGYVSRPDGTYTWTIER